MSKIEPSSFKRVVPKRQLDHEKSYAQHLGAGPGHRRSSLKTNVNFFMSPQKNEIDAIDHTTGVTLLIQACENNSLSK